jgi:hypothetical protein
MTKRIFKYPLKTGTNELELPVGSLILDVICQNKTLTMYVMVNDTEDKVTRTIQVFGTGWVLPEENLEYINTVDVGIFVWHVFEQLPKV